jgi:prepilin-type N-terminal cleavage/methylation domain-containing protein
MRLLEMRPRVWSSGFTIIELLMVMAIIAIISAVALPKLDFSRYRIDAAVRGLASGLARAQRQAVTNQSNVNVLFDVANKTFKIHEDDNNDNVIQPAERVRQYPLGDGVEYGLGTTPVRTYAPGPVTFTRTLGGLPEIIFRRDGSASENGAVYITSLNATARGRTSDARSVELIQATGRVEWYRYTGAAWQRKF